MLDTLEGDEAQPGRTAVVATGKDGNPHDRRTGTIGSELFARAFWRHLEPIEEAFEAVVARFEVCATEK